MEVLAAPIIPFRPALTVTGGLAVASVLVASTFGSDDGPVLCVFRRCTGGYCPSCGGSRAAASLVRGELVGAWSIHPWVILLAVQAVVVAAFATAGFGDRLRAAAVSILTTNAVLGLAVWTVRLAAGTIPVPFG